MVEGTKKSSVVWTFFSHEEKRRGRNIKSHQCQGETIGISFKKCFLSIGYLPDVSTDFIQPKQWQTLFTSQLRARTAPLPHRKLLSLRQGPPPRGRPPIVGVASSASVVWFPLRRETNTRSSRSGWKKTHADGLNHGSSSASAIMSLLCRARINTLKTTTENPALVQHGFWSHHGPIHHREFIYRS